MWIKLIGALFLLASGGAVAYFLNRGIERRIAQTEALVSLLKLFRMQIDCYCVPIGEIFRRADTTLLEKCGFNGTPRDSEAFRSMLEKSTPRDVASVLSSFADELGSSYREEQLKSCDLHTARLNEILSKQKADARPQKKLNTVLCLSAAAGIVILFI